jgi:YD repeat-containing protein
MQCRSCGAEVQIEQGMCLRCGALIGLPGEMQPPSGGKGFRSWVVISGVLVFLILAAVLPALIFWKAGFFQKRAPYRSTYGRRPPTPKASLNQQHVPAKLRELQAEGEVYLVPIGPQAIAPGSLLEHYKSKFNLSLHLLPPLPLEPRAFDSRRKQYILEEMIEQMKRAHPELTPDVNAVMIALTNEDIYARSNGEDYVCSYRTEGRYAVISTRRMDDVFWGSRAKPDLTLRRLEHTLTKDIAMLHYTLSLSSDPESVLDSETLPDGRPDDLWESDIHPEDSADGLTGQQYCLALHYSYRAQKTVLSPRDRDCGIDDWRNTELETFLIVPQDGHLSVYKTDFNLGGKPEIVFVRVTQPTSTESLSLGKGTDHFYNTHLVAPNQALMNEMNLMFPTGGRWRFERTSPGRGFSPDMVFTSKDEGDFYGARITWDGSNYLLKQASGESYLYLPCSGNARCLENAYQDEDGNKLNYTRSPDQSLTGLQSAQKSLKLTYDSSARISAVEDQNGHTVRYEYDDAGYLSKVTTASGTVTSYDRSANGRSLTVSVTRKGQPKEAIFAAEFDSAGRVVKVTVPRQGNYTLDYDLDGSQVTSALITSPQGKKLRLDYDEDDGSFEAHSEN